MATEISITSARPVGVSALHTAGVETVPGCALLELRGGEVWVVITPAGERLLTVHASTPIEVRTDVEALVGPDLAEAAWWTSATVPHGGSEEGIALARALASVLDGAASVVS